MSFLNLHYYHYPEKDIRKHATAFSDRQIRKYFTVRDPKTKKTSKQEVDCITQQWQETEPIVDTKNTIPTNIVTLFHLFAIAGVKKK